MAGQGHPVQWLTQLSFPVGDLVPSAVTPLWPGLSGSGKGRGRGRRV